MKRTLHTWPNVYALSVRNVDDVQVALGCWVRGHVPPGVPVATHDVGTIGYLSDHTVLDIVGLVAPRFIALDASNRRLVARARSTPPSGATGRAT